MNPRRLAFVYPTEIQRLSYPPDCPFKTRRSGETLQLVRSLGLLDGETRRVVAATQADRNDLVGFHSARYLDVLERAAAGELTPVGLELGLGTPDTPVFPDMLEYGRWACGAGLKAAELLLEGGCDVAFSLVGGFHHAMAERAAGFCYVNDVVLVCQRLAGAGRRVFCLDLDAHHGDGTQSAFYRRRDVFTVSLHESGTTLFPGGGFEDEIGEEAGRGYNVNVPLPAGTYDEAYLHAYRRVVPPLLTVYQPDVVVIELGMDTLAGDPLTHLVLTNNAHVEILDWLMGLGRPVLVLGGGGYHAENTVRGWALAWQVCAGELETDPGVGLGGVLLANTEWAGGLRDAMRPVTAEQRNRVVPALETVLSRLEDRVFPLHGLSA